MTSLRALFPTTVTLAGLRASTYKFGGCGVHNSVHNIIKTHLYPEASHMILYKFPLSLSSKDFVIKDIHPDSPAELNAGSELLSAPAAIYRKENPARFQLSCHGHRGNNITAARRVCCVRHRCEHFHVCV